MLNNIKIQNYRNLKSLNVEKMGRVNLVIGKNNTGKTSLLEAISVYLHKGNTAWILQLLEERGEIARRSDDPKKNLVSNLKALSGLFWKRRSSFELDDRILIESKLSTRKREFNLFGEMPSGESLSIRFVKFIRTTTVSDGGRISRTQIVDDNIFDDSVETGIEISIGDSSLITPLESERLFRSGLINRSSSNMLDENIQFIRTNNIMRDTNGFLWDKISLTDNEKYVEDALKIIESRIARITFIGEARTRYEERSPVVRLKNDDLVVPLRSMGDGINRILTIILAMVNCENGYLLIDEFENGLHYSVQEKLWEIIFSLAEKLNIQVFATTHSSDTIRAFENIVNQNETVPLNGLLIKLENINDAIEATTFEPRELKVITDNLIEVRR